MSESIFSTYSSAENRVTSCFLAVLRSLAVHRMERILGSLLEDEEFSLITLEPQPSTEKTGKGHTKPDGEIFSACQILIETKIVLNGLGEDQLRGHLRQLKTQEQCNFPYLLALTPDSAKPGVIEAINDKRLRWASFAQLNKSVKEILEDREDVISEREQFLLREFQRLLDNMGLLEPEKNVVVVAAPVGWTTYNDYSVYVCKASRPLGQAKYLAFYGNSAIHHLVPEILECREEVEFVRGQPGPVGKKVDELLDKASRSSEEKTWHREGKQTFAPGMIAKVVLLSAPDDPRTVRLPQPVKNDKKSRSGKGVAFTQWQKYVSLAKLKEAATTSLLE